MAKYKKPKYSQKLKDAYLRYYRKKGRKFRPVKFATYVNMRKKTKGLSTQTQKQVQGLSSEDYKAVSKFLGK